MLSVTNELPEAEGWGGCSIIFDGTLPSGNQECGSYDTYPQNIQPGETFDQFGVPRGCRLDEETRMKCINELEDRTYACTIPTTVELNANDKFVIKIKAVVTDQWLPCKLIPDNSCKDF